MIIGQNAWFIYQDIKNLHALKIETITAMQLIN